MSKSTATSFNCPVCNVAIVGGETTTCANCKTDLQPIVRIRAVKAAARVKTGIFISTLLVMFALLCVTAHSLSQSRRNQHESYTRAASKLADYQRFHTWQDEDVIKLSDNLKLAEKTMSAREREIGALRLKYDDLNIAFGNLSNALARSESSREAAAKVFSEYSSSHQRSNRDFVQLAGEVEGFQSSILATLLTIVGSNSPASAKASDTETGPTTGRFEERREEKPSDKERMITKLLAELRDQRAEAKQVPKPVHSVPTPKILDLNISSPGVATVRSGASLRLQFDEGLFLRGRLLSPEAKRTLASLASELRPLADKVQLEIIGHTDEPPFLGNAISLGYKRALDIGAILRSQAGFSSAAIAVKSLGTSFLPFLNDTPSERARNRTVVIIITPKEM